MYNAYIARIKDVKKHYNADKLNVGKCFGNQVIVSLETKEGDIGVYFPSDGQLGLEYCEANNLLIKKNEEGINIGGYLEPSKRNIRALKLRGEVSDGLFMPLKSLSSFTDISKLKEGDLISLLNGVEICRKYVPIQKTKISSMSNITKGKRTLKNEKSYPLFHEHSKTNQLMYNLNDFKVGDVCYITLKCHGCFQSTVSVNIWGESKSKRISQVKKGDFVVGMNEKGELVRAEVLELHKNGSCEKWAELEISRKGLHGEKSSKIRCTDNHLFFNHATKKYQEANRLSEGDEIYTLKRTRILSQTQKSILLGLALGDGCLSLRSHGSGKVEFGHKKEHFELVKYTSESLGDISRGTYKEYISGYGSEIIRSSTKELLSIGNFLTEHINLPERTLNESIIDDFDEIALAFLYMGDGSLSHDNKQKDRACIAVCSFNEDSCNILVKAINKLGLYPVLFKDSEGYYRIRFNTLEAYKMFDMIEKYIPNVVKYKLPKEYHNRECCNIREESNDGYIFTKQTILSKRALIEKKQKYDLETTTGNYCVNGVLVHNSSSRHSNTIVSKDMPLKGMRKLVSKIKNDKLYETVKSWELVSGSRRVILDNFEGGYYGDNKFRKKWHDFFEGKLKKGETVYGEIVGYTENGTPIMPSVSNKKTNDKSFIKKYGEKTTYSYGCKVGENDIYVYRMTLTNEDGFEVDYPWDFVKTRCEQMGMKHVPEIDRFIYSNQDDLMERVNKDVEESDPIGLNHVREGYVVRIEGRETFKALKHKSFYFKLLEGLIKDEGVLDMEEAEGESEEDA